MKTLCLSVIVVMAISWVDVAPVQANPFVRGKTAWASGDWAVAEVALKEAISQTAQNGDALALQVRLYLVLGRWDEARKASQKLAKLPGRDTEAAVLHAEVDLAVGQYDTVISTLLPLVSPSEPLCALRWALGRAFLWSGRTADAFDVLDPIADFYLDSRITTAEDLTYLGHALWSLGHFKNANDVFAEATKADSAYLPAHVGWGELFLSKYNYRDADQTFKDVLKLRPNDPDALIGMARIDLDSDNDPAKAMERAQQVLAIIPNHVAALRIVSTVHRYNERYEDALVTIQTALRTNPNDIESLAELAAIHYLRDDTKAFQATVDRALAVHPRFARVYAHAANAGERVHRYQEGVALFEQALLLDPELSDAHIGLGIGYSRMGDDEKARQHLDMAHSLDPYNVRVFNLASVFYDSMIQEFALDDRSGLRFRFHKSEKPVLDHFVVPSLVDGKLALDKRYRFEPEGPIQIEIFPDAKLFSIRTVGLPKMAAHGVCFGKIVTARSPSEGNFNWRQVLYHELAHIYHIQLSRSRVPRWFTEGLAVHETRVLRSQWDQPMKLEMARAIRNGRVVKVGQFNQAFTLARSFDDILVAYYQASLVAQFIDETWGFEALRAMLVAWGDKKSTSEVIQSVLSVTTEELDTRFLTWIKAKFDAYVSAYEPHASDYSDFGRFKKNADENPTDVQAIAELGAAQLAQGDPKSARETFLKSLELDQSNRLSHYMLGQLALSADDPVSAIQHLKIAVVGGSESISARLTLAQALIAQGSVQDATAHYDAILKLDPDHVEALNGLAAIAEASSNVSAAWDVLGRAADADQKNVKLALMASRGARTANEVNKAKHFADLALEIAPFDGEVIAVVALEKAAAGQAQQAIGDLLIGVEHARDHKERVWVAMAQVKLQLGDKPGAKLALESALQGAPNDAEALELMKQF